MVAPGTEFTPRINQVDFAASKTFKVDSLSFTPKLDIFNALNSDDYTSVTSSQFNAAHLSAAVGRAAGPHHPDRRRCEVVT